MTDVRVALGDRSYDVRIETGLIDRAGAEIAPLLNRPRVAIVTEEHVAALHLDRLREALAAEGIDSEALVLPRGEGTKNWENLTRTVEWLLSEKIERRDILIALGGGGDESGPHGGDCSPGHRRTDRAGDRARRAVRRALSVQWFDVGNPFGTRQHVNRRRWREPCGHRGSNHG